MSPVHATHTGFSPPNLDVRLLSSSGGSGCDEAVLVMNGGLFAYQQCSILHEILLDVR